MGFNSRCSSIVVLLLLVAVIASDSENGTTTTSKPESRQMGFYPSPFYPSGFSFLRRQFNGGMEALGDFVMLGMIGLPILGLLTAGSMSIGNLLGLKVGSRKTSSGASSKRNRRDLAERASEAVQYARNIWEVMEQLEKAFEKYGIYHTECRLRTVCEAHSSNQHLGSWGESIVNLMRKQKDLQNAEIFPVARFLFSNYADAARSGEKDADCSQLYSGCPNHLSTYIDTGEEEDENEILAPM